MTPSADDQAEDTQAEDTQANESGGTSRRRPMSTSRRISLAVYGVSLIFVTVSGFRSVIPQVFWPTDETPWTAHISDCDAEAASLERMLLASAATHVGAGGRPASATPPSWLPGWDSHFHAFERACPQQNITSLERLRFRIERTLWRFDRNEAERVAELPELAAGSTP